MARDFRKIIAWQKADDLAFEIYKVTSKFFPPEEKYGLTAQTRSAAFSAPANIAVGAGRKTLKDFTRLLYNARRSHLRLAT